MGKRAPVLVGQAASRGHRLVVVGVALGCLEAEERFELREVGGRPGTGCAGRQQRPQTQLPLGSLRRPRLP